LASGRTTIQPLGDGSGDHVAVADADLLAEFHLVGDRLLRALQDGALRRARRLGGKRPGGQQGRDSGKKSDKTPMHGVPPSACWFPPIRRDSNVPASGQGRPVKHVSA
jgi:hypothetical protein